MQGYIVYNIALPQDQIAAFVYGQVQNPWFFTAAQGSDRFSRTNTASSKYSARRYGHCCPDAAPAAEPARSNEVPAS